MVFVGIFSLGTIGSYFLGQKFGEDMMFPHVAGASLWRSAFIFHGAMLAFFGTAMAAGAKWRPSGRRAVPQWAVVLAGLASSAWLVMLSAILLAFGLEGPPDIPFGPQLLGFYLEGALVVAVNLAGIVLLAVANRASSSTTWTFKSPLTWFAGASAGLTAIVAGSVLCAL